MFEVHGDAARMQLDIDLAAAHPGRERKDDCCCGESDDEPPTVSPKGYVLFHAKSGSGWSVQIGEDEPAAFDSMRLTKGDMFALMLLEPTRYRIENTISQVRASAEVGFSDADARRLSGLLPVTVDAGAAFNPEALKLVSTQGLVFRIESDARIVITREEKRDPEPRRGARRVQRPRPRAAGPARPPPPPPPQVGLSSAKDAASPLPACGRGPPDLGSTRGPFFGAQAGNTRLAKAASLRSRRG